ncbi:ParA family protein [Microtetraspora malaysiensis]|uniref:ParA family protein n=1 Tax=Microtetraspora malaysiensis TaxID=161358 RepID=UPI00082AA961|nr:ParA family protein [Microtetraspora malaysiensis]
MTIDATASSGAHGAATARRTDSYLITIANQKGGVGKTMLTLSLAAHTAKANGRAFVWDIDPQANAYDLTSVMNSPGYDVVHELDPNRVADVRRMRQYDTVFIDCPGSLEGREILSQIVRASTFVLIPYDHEPESILPTLRTARRVAELGIPYAVVVTKANPQVGADHVLDAWKTLEDQQIPHFQSFVRLYRAWPNSLKAGVPITRWNERYAPKVREDIAAVHTELLLNIGRIAGARP